MKRVKLLHSASLRVAALFVGLFAASILVAFGVLYAKVQNDMDEHQKAYVLEVQKALLDVLERGGFAALTADVGARVTSISDDDTVYILTNDSNEFVAGNVQSVPLFSGWKLIPWDQLQVLGRRRNLEPEEGVLGTWSTVPGGHLFVGNSDGDSIEAQEMLLEGLGLALAVAIAAALIGGTYLGLRTRQRIDHISRALDAVAEGDLTVRIPGQPTNDELSHIADRINTTLDRLQSSVANMRQVTTDIAHDLKSPIGRIRQRLQKARETTQSIEDYGDVVDTTVAEIDNIVDTFNALLSISQIEAGLQKQRFAVQSLGQILATVFDAYEAVADDAGQTLAGNFDALGDAPIFGDRDLLTQLFANLVENAIRHCPPGSRIYMTAEATPNGPVVKVLDNGPGIAPAERQNVFRRLYRLEKSRTTPGSGLGLSLVAAIADLHEARIDLSDNAPGLVVVIQFQGCAPASATPAPLAMAAE